MSQSSYVKSQPDLVTLGGGELEWETGNLAKRFELRNRDETLWEHISYRYVIDVIGTDLFSVEELGGVDLEKLEK